MNPAQSSSAELRQQWCALLGAVPDEAGSWQLGGHRHVSADFPTAPVQQLVLSSYGTDIVAELLRPVDESSGWLIVVPFYDTPSVFGEPTARTRLQGKASTQNAHGLQLVADGHSVLAVPWWTEVQAAADPETADQTDLAARYGPVASRHSQERSTTGLGRSIADLMLAVTALEESGLSSNVGLACFGHSLGGKLSMYLTALDPRIEVGAAHEAGLGYAHSNWGEEWYLGSAFPRHQDQDQLLALVAPRPFLVVGGGDSDGIHNIDLVRSARRSWPDDRGLELLLHDGGHAMPKHVMAGVSAWFRGRPRTH